MPLRFLSFDLSDGDDGVTTLDALASTRAEHQPAVLAEVQQVLDWAERHFPGQHAPLEDGGTWLHELQVQDEPGGWRSVALTFSATPEFAQALLAEFGSDDE
jgi:hypothetical protein